jgi:hypothetical protein
LVQGKATKMFCGNIKVLMFVDGGHKEPIVRNYSIGK